MTTNTSNESSDRSKPVDLSQAGNDSDRAATRAARRKARIHKQALLEIAPKDGTDIPLITQTPDSLRRFASSGFWMSICLAILLPTLLTASYYLFIASDQYASHSHFVVKQRSTGVGAIPSLSGASPIPGGAILDTLIIKDYLLSSQIIRDLEGVVDLRAIYTRKDIDWFARLKPSFGENVVTDEQLLKYWQSIATAHFDMSTSITTFQVRAFTAQDAKKIADEVFVLSEKLVNKLSLRSQEDALSLARKEVDTCRDRALTALDSLQKFQENVKQVDPNAFAASRNQIQAFLEKDITKLQAQLDILRKSLPEEAPAIVQIRDRISVMDRQLALEREKSTMSTSGESAASVLNQYAKLSLEKEFATDAFKSSLASLESARLEAIRKNLYLETYVRPNLPQSSEYPEAVLNTILVLIASTALWGIGYLFISSVREHC